MMCLNSTGVLFRFCCFVGMTMIKVLVMLISSQQMTYCLKLFEFEYSMQRGLILVMKSNMKSWHFELSSIWYVLTCLCYLTLTLGKYTFEIIPWNCFKHIISHQKTLQFKCSTLTTNIKLFWGDTQVFKMVQTREHIHTPFLKWYIVCKIKMRSWSLEKEPYSKRRKRNRKAKLVSN